MSTPITLDPVSGPSDSQTTITAQNIRISELSDLANFHRRKYEAITMMVSMAADKGACSEFASGILDNVDYVTRMVGHSQLDLTDQLADIIAYVAASDEVSDYLDCSLYTIVDELAHRVADQIGVSRTKVTCLLYTSDAADE